MSEKLPRYDPRRSYQWNYDHAPDPTNHPGLAFGGSWNFCRHPVDSPLGVAAGPLLNGKWCLYYAGLGFDVLTYKTVRSGVRDCYPMPNLQPVNCDSLQGHEPHVLPCQEMQGSWAVSFGMPSSSPEVWRNDIAWTRRQLSPEKLLSVSVVGTMQDGWSIEQLAQDYAICAKWAVESGADCIETNFSCPNVSTCDGQLYLDADSSHLVVRTVKQEIGTVPLIVKIGHLSDENRASALLDAIGEEADAIAMTNSIATLVGSDPQAMMFDHQQRGICGTAIRDASLRQVELFSNLIARHSFTTQIIGVGGIENANDVDRYLMAGASACHLATSIMTDPEVAIKIRQSLAG